MLACLASSRFTAKTYIMLTVCLARQSGPLKHGGLRRTLHACMHAASLGLIRMLRRQLIQGSYIVEKLMFARRAVAFCNKSKKEARRKKASWMLTIQCNCFRCARIFWEFPEIHALLRKILIHNLVLSFPQSIHSSSK